VKPNKREFDIVMRTLLLFFLIFPYCAQGGVFKCVINGEVSYQSTPCISGQVPFKGTSTQGQHAPHAQDYSNKNPAIIQVDAPHSVGVAGSASRTSTPSVAGQGSSFQEFGAAVPAPILLEKKGLKGIAAYADGRTDLTPEQIEIGFALSSVGSRARALTLIKQARGSVDFPIWKNSPSSPLINAASNADIEMISVILAKGIAVDSALSSSWLSRQTALIAAVSSTSYAYKYLPWSHPPERFLETIKFLLKAGANPNAKSSNGWTPMNVALGQTPPDPAGEKIKISILTALLDSGANPGTALPLDSTSNEREIEITKLLLGHGFDPKAQDSMALASAVHNRRPSLVNLMLTNGADPNTRALYGGINGKRSVLADALVMGQTEIAIALMKAGANPNKCSEESDNGKCEKYGVPLFFMTLHDSKLFHMMVAKGINPNAEDAQGQTALGYTISYRTYHQQGISKVCVAGTTNCKDLPKEKFDKADAVRILLIAGADPNKRSSTQIPLLMTDESDHEVITLLLDKGARLESINIGNEVIGPISQTIAAHRSFLSGELLRRSKGKLRTDEKWALYIAAAKGKMELAETLIQGGIKPDERGPLGETALHYAAHTGNAAMIKHLLTLGANPNAQTDAMHQVSTLGTNPYALLEAHMQEKQKIYVAVGLQPPAMGDGKVTPLMLAVISRDVEVTKALLDKGAKVETKSQQGLSALDIAHKMRNQEIEKLLATRLR